MKHYTFLFLPLFFSPNALFSQENIDIDGKPCSIYGSAKNSRDVRQNMLKNRYENPEKSDFDPNFTLEAVTQGEDDRGVFQTKKAARIRGYVIKVKDTNRESCNCNSNDPRYKDTHIEVVLDLADKSASQVVIVEVTPRFRLLAEQAGFDWSTKGLKKRLTGKLVEFEGWLFYDAI